MSGNYKTIELLVEICDGELAEIKKNPHWKDTQTN